MGEQLDSYLWKETALSNRICLAHFFKNQQKQLTKLFNEFWFMENG